MTEEQRYTDTQKFPGFELRHYEACVVADVHVDGSFESAGSAGFRPLIQYISGGNSPAQKVAMTAPVIQQPSQPSQSKKIAMTAPVLQSSTSNHHIVSFVMPAGSTLEQMPKPTDSRVTLRAISEQLVAIDKFSGRWTSSGYDERLKKLHVSVTSAGFTPIGDARFARFDPPWTPWFMRRNEIQLPVSRTP
ncbi:MAG: heme-binding protein [Actinomycetes bacterium]